MLRPEVPVILLPGLLGSRLGLRGQRGLIWGDVRSFYVPRDRGRHLQVPAQATCWGDVEARGILETVPVIPWLYAVPVYSDLLRHLVEACGYVPGRTLFPYAYDFRRDTLTLVRGLACYLEEVGRASGAPEVVLVGHSHGGIIASYLARFGIRGQEGADCPEHEARLPCARVRIRAVVTLAAAFRGSLDNLRMMIDGYRVAPLGFHYGPLFHVLARAPIETLPPPGTPCFEDESGRPLEQDVYQLETWREHRLGIFAPDAKAGGAGEELEGQMRQLDDGLFRAAGLHELFARPLPPGVAPHHVIAGTGFPTLKRAVLGNAASGWRADFTRGLRVPGDGEVDAGSAAGWRGPESGPVRTVHGTHRHLINFPETWTVLAEELAAIEHGRAGEEVAT